MGGCTSRRLFIIKFKSKAAIAEAGGALGFFLSASFAAVFFGDSFLAGSGTFLAEADSYTTFSCFFLSLDSALASLFFVSTAAFGFSGVFYFTGVTALDSCFFETDLTGVRSLLGAPRLPRGVTGALLEPLVAATTTSYSTAF